MSDPCPKEPSDDKVPVFKQPAGSMEHSLKELLVQCTSLAIDSGSSGPTAALTAEDKLFLERALESTVQSKKEEDGLVSMMKAMEKLCKESRQPTDDEMKILTLLEEATEDFDPANAYINMGGIKLCHRLLEISNSDLQVISLNIIGNVALNNEAFQNHPDGKPLLKKILLMTKGSNHLAKTNLISAVSNIISSNGPYIEFILKDPDIGLDFFFDLYEDIYETSFPYHIVRTGHVIGHIFRDFPKSCELEVSPRRAYTFFRNLLDKWWQRKGHVPEFMNSNLRVLYALYTGKYQRLRDWLKPNLDACLKDMLENMRVAHARGLRTAEEDEVQLVADFERAVDVNPNPGLLAAMRQFELSNGN